MFQDEEPLRLVKKNDRLPQVLEALKMNAQTRDFTLGFCFMITLLAHRKLKSIDYLRETKIKVLSFLAQKEICTHVSQEFCQAIFIT